MAGVVVRSGLNAKFEVQVGSDWATIPYVGDVSYSGRDAPSTDVVAFEGVGQITGHARVGRLSMTAASYIPNLKVWKDLEAAQAAGTRHSYRFTTAERIVRSVSADRCAIATSGVFTLSAMDTGFDARTSDDILVGMTIEISGTSYTIESITGALTGTVLGAPSGAVAASACSFNVPSLRLGPFSAMVVSVGNFNAPTEDAMTSGLELAPTSPIPNWTIVD